MMSARAVKTPDRAAAEDYRRAFLALGPQMTETRRKLLQIHYQAYGHQLTMSQMAEAMSWPNYCTSNIHYGKLAQLVSEQIGFEPQGAHLSALCTFVEPEEPGDHWLIIMRPQVAEALQLLGWT